MDYECSKCSRWGMVWDGRAKVISCLYHKCRHVIKLSSFEHHGIPMHCQVQAAIDKDRENGKRHDEERLDTNSSQAL